MKPDGETARTLGDALGLTERREAAPAMTRPRPPARPSRAAPAVFGLGETVGLGSVNRPRDVIAAKRALAWAGHYPATKAQEPDGRVDDDLVAGIGISQLAMGLTNDNWMGPDGETARALDAAVAPEVALHAKAARGHNVPDRRVTLHTDTSSPAEERKVAVAVAAVPAVAAIAKYAGVPIAAASAWWVSKSPGEREKMLRDLERLYPGGDPAPSARTTEDDRKPSSWRKRTAIVDPPPATPGREPPELPDPSKEELRPTREGKPATTVFPDPGEREATIETFPKDDTLAQWIIYENSRGNLETQEKVDFVIWEYAQQLRKRGLNSQHDGGGHSPDQARRYTKELYLRPSQGVRAARPDGSFVVNPESPEPQYLDFNVANTLKDGKTPDRREANAYERINKLKTLLGRPGPMVAFPKGEVLMLLEKWVGVPPR